MFVRFTSTPVAASTRARNDVEIADRRRIQVSRIATPRWKIAEGGRVGCRVATYRHDKELLITRETAT